jgi:cholinesterase
LNNSAYWYNASAALGCPIDSPKASISCMRGKSTADILKVTRVTNPLEAVLGHYGPTTDNKVVFSDYKERAAAGKFIQKPYFIGNNDYEAGLFVLMSQAAKLNISENVWTVFNAAVFTCPVARAAEARAKKGLLTYRYRYFGDYPNTRLQDKSGSW